MNNKEDFTDEDENEFKMDISIGEKFKDMFDLGQIKDRGLLTDESFEQITRLVEAEKQIKDPWAKLMNKHYQLEFVVMFMLSILSDLVERVDNLEESV